MLLPAAANPFSESSSGPGLGLALQGYQTAMTGLFTRGIERVNAAIAALKGSPGAEASLGISHALLGLIARAECDWAEAERCLAQAVDRLVAAGQPGEASWLLALRVEALSCVGRIDEARGALDAWSSRDPGAGFSDLGNAVVQFARGAFAEAEQIAGAVPEGGQRGAWAALLRAEIDLDAGRPQRALERLTPLVTAAGARIDEAWVRALFLAARAQVESALGAAAKGSPAGREAARSAVERAAGYATSFERYRAGALALEADLALLGDRAEAPRLFDAAVAALEGCGAQLDLGRAIARHVAFRSALAEQPLQPLIARGRDLLTRARADARSQDLARGGARGGPAEGNASVFLAQSVLGRSMLAAGIGDEVELQALFEVNRAIASVLDLDELLQRILDEVVKLLKAGRGALLRKLPDGTIRCVAARGLMPERVVEGGGEVPFSVLREVERSRQAVLTDNAQVDERFRGKGSVMASDVRSILCAPLQTKNALHGFLYLDSTVKARVFKEAQKELLALFATQAAVSIENALAFHDLEQFSRTLEQRVEERTAELAGANASLKKTIEDLTQTRIKLLEAEKQALEREMELARGVQNSIVPGREAIRRPGLSVLGWLESAAQVGGDFWTQLALPGDKTLLFVGDVTGHGLGPGMLTTVAKACCDTLVRKLGEVTLDVLLGTLSDVLHDSSHGQLSMTAFAAIFDPAERTLAYASAAHVPPLYLEAAEGLARLKPLMSPRANRLGDGLGNTFQVQTVKCAPKDRLLLFTDGLTECTNAEDEEYGAKRLRAAAVAGARGPLGQHLAHVLEDARRFYGAHPREDDVTVVLAEID